MSRIGNRILAIPEGVTLEITGSTVVVKGPKGELKKDFDKAIKIEVKDNQVVVTRDNDAIATKQLHGTTNALIKNMMEGVSKGYEKSLEIVGVGYRFTLKGSKLVINAGFSHPVECDIPEGVKVDVKSNTELTISGIDKVLVGEYAANIRKIKKPEPYKGKGIKYSDEHIRRKEGKKAK